MAEARIVLAAALSFLLLASCGGREPAATENGSAAGETNVPDNGGMPEPAPADGTREPSPDSVPPPDAVSHPEGYLPPASEAPPPSAPEPATDPPPGSKAPPPATEDQYMRNRQGGG